MTTMANLQVKRVPEDLYRAAQARAEAEGLTLSAWVIRLLERETTRRPRSEVLAEIRRHALAVPDDITGAKLVREARDEL